MSKLKELQWDCDVKLSEQCRRDEDEADKNNVEYECTCPDPITWSKEKCEEFLNEA